MTRLEELEQKDFETLTDEELQELFELQVDRDSKINIDHFSDILEEAEDRVWFDRNTIGTDLEEQVCQNMPEDIRQGALEAVKRIKEKYGVDESDINDFYHGYWSGILALARFLTGYYGTDLDDLRSGESLLDS